MVPITSLAQYTTAPTFRSGYILNSDNVLQRPANIATPPTSLAGGEPTYLGHQYQQQQQQQQPPLSMQTTSGSVLTPATATLRRMKQTTPAAAATASPPHVLQQAMVSGSISTYDGIPPRTLSTGMAVNSQFYYE